MFRKPVKITLSTVIPIDMPETYAEAERMLGSQETVMDCIHWAIQQREMANLRSLLRNRLDAVAVVESTR